MDKINYEKSLKNSIVFIYFKEKIGYKKMHTF